MNRNLTNRDLDGVYFRIERDGKWDDICFSDLTDHEMDMVLLGYTMPALVRLCKVLGKTIREIGDIFDLDLNGGEDDG